MTKLEDIGTLVDQITIPETDHDQIISQLLSFPSRTVDGATFHPDTIVKPGTGLNVAYCAVFCTLAVFAESKQSGNIEAEQQAEKFLEKLLQNEHLKNELKNDVNKTFPDDETGCTLLNLAALHHIKNVADLLIKAGANVDLADKKGDTPTHQAITGMTIGEGKNYQDGLEIINLLASMKANTKSTNLAGKTAYNLLCDNVKDIDDNLRQSFLEAASGKLSCGVKATAISRLVDGGKTIEQATKDFGRV